MLQPHWITVSYAFLQFVFSLIRQLCRWFHCKLHSHVQWTVNGDQQLDQDACAYICKVVYTQSNNMQQIVQCCMLLPTAENNRTIVLAGGTCWGCVAFSRVTYRWFNHRVRQYCGYLQGTCRVPVGGSTTECVSTVGTCRVPVGGLTTECVSTVGTCRVPVGGSTTECVGTCRVPVGAVQPQSASVLWVPVGYL